MDKWSCLRCGNELEEERGKRPLFCDNPACGKHGPFHALTGPFTFFDGEKFIPKKLADTIAGLKRFVTHAQSHVIWVYGNGSYAPDGDNAIREEVRELLGNLANEGRVNEVAAHVRETTYTEQDKFEAPIDLINLKNGIYNLKTGELAPHTPDIIFTNELPVEYNEHVGCPDIMQFLSEIVSSEDIPVIQEIVGYCLYRAYILAKALMLLGEGANGKSTLLKLMIALLGEDNIATPALQDLIYDRFAKAQLYGKLANIHADLPTTKLTHTGVFKMLTGQDRIYGQKKHQDPFDFYNYAKLIYSANELPMTNDMSEAFWRRWIVIKFPNSFPEGDPKTNPNILAKLTTPSELSGFLSWGLTGLKRLLEQGRFTTTRTRDEIEEEWVMRTDSLRAFTMKHIKKGVELLVQKDTFYEQYNHFCDYHDITSFEKAVVGRRLPTLIPNIVDIRPELGGKRQVRCWKGIAVTDIQGNVSYGIQKGDDDIYKEVGDMSDICQSSQAKEVKTPIEKTLAIIFRLKKDEGNVIKFARLLALAQGDAIDERIVFAVIDDLKLRGKVIDMGEGMLEVL